jgi:hypothetical protein
MSSAAEAAEFLLKTGHHGAADEAGRPQGLLDDFEQLVLQLLMWGNKIQKRDMRAIHRLRPP